MRFVRGAPSRYCDFYAASQTMPPMKTPTARIASAAAPARGIGLIAAILLFSLAAFRLMHLPATLINHDALDLWRGSAIGSLYLLLCLSAGRSRPNL
jgi:hypothetical protein